MERLDRRLAEAAAALAALGELAGKRERTLVELDSAVLRLIYPEARCGGVERSVIDTAAREFVEAVYYDPWDAMDLDLPLPDGLDLDALQSVRPVVYALLQALDLTLGEATGLIGRLVEIDRRIARLTRPQLVTPV